MLNVFESVSSNKTKSTIIMVLFVAFVSVSAYFISLAFGWRGSSLSFLGLAFIFSGLGSLASYYWSDKIILGMSGAHPADPQKNRVFYSVAQNLSLAASLPMPKLYIIVDTALNAFATGRDPQHAVVCATSGLLSRLSRTELEGVIGHELSHVANYDIRLMSIVTILVGTLTLLGDWLIRSRWSLSRDDDSRSGAGQIGMLIGLVLALISPLIAQLIQLAISRRREFLADAFSAKLTRQPSGLISALTKLGADTEPLEAANKATAHLYITNPLKNHHDLIGWFSGLFNTHPPLDHRIQALQRMS